jgi:hypothetical protein
MQFTLSLSPMVANRIRELVEPYGGSIPGFAAKLATDVSALPVRDQEKVRALIAQKLKQLPAASPASTPSLDIGSIPAIPHRRLPRADPLHYEEEPQHPAAQKRRAHSSKPNGTDATPSVETQRQLCKAPAAESES